MTKPEIMMLRTLCGACIGPNTRNLLDIFNNSLVQSNDQSIFETGWKLRQHVFNEINIVELRGLTENLRLLFE